MKIFLRHFPISICEVNVTCKNFLTSCSAAMASILPLTSLSVWLMTHPSPRRQWDYIDVVDGSLAGDVAEHERLELKTVLLLEAAELLHFLLDPLPREALLAHHFSALVLVGEFVEEGEDELRPKRRQPHLRHGVVRVVYDGAGFSSAEGAQLTFLIKPFFHFL